MKYLFVCFLMLTACFQQNTSETMDTSSTCGSELCLIIDESDVTVDKTVASMDELKIGNGNFKPIAIDGNSYDIEYLASGKIGDAYILKGDNLPLDGKVLKLPQDNSDTKIKIFKEELLFEHWLAEVDLAAYGTSAQGVDITFDLDGEQVKRQGIVKEFIGGTLVTDVDAAEPNSTLPQKIIKLYDDFEKATQKSFYDPARGETRYGYAYDLHGKNMKIYQDEIRIVDARFESCDQECAFVFEIEFEKSTRSLRAKWSELREKLSVCAF